MIDPPRQRVRVSIVQPSLANYRVPLFRQLAAVPWIDLTVVYAKTARLNAEPDGFRARFEPMVIRHLRGHPVYWQSAQIAAATRARCDVLILNWDVHYASLIPALIRARMNGVRTVLWGHGTSRNDGTWKALPRQWLARLPNALLFYSFTSRNRYAELGFPRNRLFVAPNALDLVPIEAAKREWLADPAKLQRFRAEHRLGPGPVLLFVSRLDPQRRVDILLQAAAILRRNFPDLQVVLIGTGPAEPGLRKLAADLALESVVRFLGPIYDEQALAPWFLSASAFVYPSYMGLSLMHALAYGVPVVTGDRLAEHGPEIEALVHGRNGLLFTHNDSAGLAEAIKELDRRSIKDLPSLPQGSDRSTDKMADSMAKCIAYLQSGPAPVRQT